MGWSAWSHQRTDGRVTREDTGRPIGGSVVVQERRGKKRKGEEGYITLSSGDSQMERSGRQLEM